MAEAILDTNSWAENVLAATMLLRDSQPPSPLNGLYIHGLSEGMVKSSGIFKQAARLSITHGLPIAFNGSDGEQFSHNEDGDENKPVGKNPGQGWPGKDWYIEQLTANGVDKNLLLPTGPGYHTRHEVIQLVRFAKEQDWDRVGIMSVAWHYPLVFTLLVDVMKKADRFIAAYALPPEYTNWQYPIKGSQGLEDTHPLREAITYAPRVLRYQDISLASSFQDMFRYLRDREQIAFQNKW